jgi:polysaccharide pyruvyl transferase WcaK-like protein/GT2 family glycosyltransferase/SAM-dependent methyltransferase
MKIFVSDVWSVYNAGDRAILEALLDGLRALYPTADIAIGAHFVEGCAEIEGVTVVADRLAFDGPSYIAQLAQPDGVDAGLDDLRRAYREADLVVSTGGYFLNACPGNAFASVFLTRLLHLGWALDAGVPVAVLGQSVGPIDGASLRAAAHAVLGRVPALAVRDVPSLSFLHRSGIAPHARLTADLAVSLTPAGDDAVDAAMERLGIGPGTLGISVRHHPDTPDGFFDAVARVADRAIRTFDVDVVLIGTTVPPADAPTVRERERALGNDDSLALRLVHDRMKERARAVVVDESLPPRLLKGVLARCRAFLGTRMHASILATTAGVPAAGIAYEYKVRGWFERLGLGDLVVPLRTAGEADLWRCTEHILAHGPEVHERLAAAVPTLQRAALDNLKAIADLVPPTGTMPDAVPGVGDRYPALAGPPAAGSAPDAALSSAAAQTGASVGAATTIREDARRAGTDLPASDPRRRWEQESAHYDVLHRRLRRIVDLAESTGGTRLLDVGCSAGTVGAALSPRWTYHGCDVSESAVRSASRGWLVPADLEAGLPAFDEQPYDVIVCSGILEYLDDPEAMLRTLVGRIAPNGTLLVSYFNMRHVSRRAGEAFRHPLWRNDFAPDEFRALVERSGWQITSTSWSTAGVGPAPDVRDEAAAVAAEPADASMHLDEIGHTLIYCARPVRSPIVARERVHASVIVPAYNRLDLLEPVLSAVLGQSIDTPFEVVVVDDGSEPTVRSLGTVLSDDRIRLIRQENRGRAGALNTGIDRARGEIVAICDSDILPDQTWLADHLAFHRAHPGVTDTHLGALVWGVDAGPFAELMGARANPRLVDHVGPVSWTSWYTDNWSFKRALLDRHAFRFDETFSVWGWEEIELAHRLERVGATNVVTGAARGAHLKAVTLDSMIMNFGRSVPNLVHLARRVGDDAVEQGWLDFRYQRVESLTLADQVVRTLIGWVESSWPTLRTVAPSLRREIATRVSDAVFGLGMAVGFMVHAPTDFTGIAIPDVDDQALLLRLADLLGATLVAADAIGDEAGAEAFTASIGAALTGYGDARLATLLQDRARSAITRILTTV